jgi:subtilisin family serine protease
MEENGSKGKADGPVREPGRVFTHMLDAPYDPWKLDSHLRKILSLIELEDTRELHLRLGTSENAKERGVIHLPVLIQLKKSEGKARDAEVQNALVDNFKVPRAYFKERARNPAFKQVTGLIEFNSTIERDVFRLQEKLKELLTYADRVSLAVPIPPSGEGALRDIGLPLDRKVNGTVVDGHGVVVGIIDDGCALAHWNFLEPCVAGSPPKTRIKYLWDQGRTVNPPTAGWKEIKGDFYGQELDEAAINTALSVPAHPRGDVLDEDKVYEYLDYKIADLASHGTHVMDIAAGNGKAMMGSEGVASAADIIFVQLPQVAVEAGKAALMKGILDGVNYIFNRAEMLGLPAVVNISYGTYAGPHDGTSQAEMMIDELLGTTKNRAVVVAAGNGFEADCHAHGDVQAGTKKKLRWIVRPEDPSPNDLEIWYSDQDQLDLYLNSPDGAIALGPIKLGTVVPIVRADGKVIGTIDHAPDAGKILHGPNAGKGAICIAISLRPTTEDSAVGNTAPAPSGEWSVGLDNPATGRVEFHAWIERDDAGRSAGARKRQSHFHPDDAHPGCTLFGLATGYQVISAGAYNTATHEVCRYSAAGPTRDGRKNKPDVCAPAAEDVAGRGVLSASSRRAVPTRMSGTSASAPHVTGLVALMLQYAADNGKLPMTAGKIAETLREGAKKSPRLLPNRHQQADVTCPIKQRAVWKDLVGGGKIDVVETLKLI